MRIAIAVAAAALLAAPALADHHSAKNWKFGDGRMPERWSLENSAYALCDSGLMQSPIDLANANAIGSVQISTNYGPHTGKIALGEEKVQVDFSPGHSMISGGTTFNLIQVHFHTPAEHAINGKRHPLTAHFVHATEAGALGVLGVMFVEGAANPELAKIVSAMQSGNGTDITVDTSKMIPSSLAVYRYMGSLTTPPCSEGVNWHVARQTMTASPEQIAALSAALGSTARSLQPLGNRLLVAPAQ